MSLVFKKLEKPPGANTAWLERTLIETEKKLNIQRIRKTKVQPREAFILKDEIESFESQHNLLWRDVKARARSVDRASAGFGSRDSLQRSLDDTLQSFKSPPSLSSVSFEAGSQRTYSSQKSRFLIAAAPSGPWSETIYSAVDRPSNVQAHKFEQLATLTRCMARDYRLRRGRGRLLEVGWVIQPDEKVMPSVNHNLISYTLPRGLTRLLSQ